MYGVMRLSQSVTSLPSGVLATVWRSPQPNRLSSVLSRCIRNSVVIGVRLTLTEAALSSGASALAAQASTANGITASSGDAPNTALP